MKFCRYNSDRLGLVRDGRVYDVTAFVSPISSATWPFPAHDVVIDHLPELMTTISKQTLSSASLALDDVGLQSPVGNPNKIIAAPVNYRAHVAEAKADFEITANRSVLPIADAGLFLKATSSVVGPRDGIQIHFPHRRTDHEVELAIVIGKTCKDVVEADALDVVAGYCIGIDVTLRGSEDRSFRKSLDTYTVLGPWLTTADEVPDPDRLRLELRVNDVRRQDSNTTQLIFGVRKLISWASEWYTLQPGDVLLSGTPEGVGPIRPGDVIDASIEGIGSMRINVGAAHLGHEQVSRQATV